jgi:hypothetical protein
VSFMQNVIYAESHKQALNAERCHYAECHRALCLPNQVKIRPQGSLVVGQTLTP